MQSLLTSSAAPDIPLLVTLPSPNPADPPLISAERRISPSWTIGQLKAKLESVVGIPPFRQTLVVKGVGELAPDEKSVGEFRLTKGMEIEIQSPHLPPHLTSNPSSNPSSSSPSSYTYTLPPQTYASRPSSVLHWKRTTKLGRFDPSRPTPHQRVQTRHARDSAAIAARGITLGQRCRVGGSDERRGTVKFVGEVPEIKGRKMPSAELIEEDGEGEKEEETVYEESGAIWVGVEFDEPVGRNDGRVGVGGEEGGGGREGEGEEEEGGKGKRYFECRGPGYGSFVRPERVEVGEGFGVLELGEKEGEGMDSDLEEL